MSLRSRPRSAVFLLLGAYAYGLLLCGLALVWEVLFRNGMPQMPWWQWLLTPLWVGFIAGLIEWAFQIIQDKTGFGAEEHRRTKRFLHLLILVVVFGILILSPAVYGIANS